MKESRRGFVLLATIATLLAGCGTAEDRINKAVPLGKDVEGDKARFDLALKALPADDRTVLEAQYQSQLKVRALQCSGGYKPSLFATTESIRAEVGNAGCFATADGELRRWMGMRRAALLAGMPPLRPVTGKPAGSLLATDRIVHVSAAEEAGVVLLQMVEGYQLVDAGTGQALGKGGKLKGLAWLAPNGRLVTTGGGAEARLLEAESGEELAQLPNPRLGRLHWMGRRGLLYFAGDLRSRLTYLDWTSGTESTVPLEISAIAGVMPAPGKADAFVVIGNDRAAMIQLDCGDKGCAPRLVQETKLSGSWGSGIVAVAGDQAFIARGKMLHRIQLETLQAQGVTFDPMLLTEVVATGDRDKLIVRTANRSVVGHGNLFLYSAANRTLARIEEDKLLTTRLIHLPAVRGNLGIDGSKLVPVGELPTGSPEPLTTVTSAIQFAEQAAKLEMEDRRMALQAARDSAVMARAHAQSSAFARPEMGGGTRSFGSGQAGLTEALRAGALRLGNMGDVNAWRSAYTSKTGQSPGRDFDERVRSLTVYVVTGDMAIPSGLNGAHAVLFVLPRGVPFPRGNPGHSPILDLQSGSCRGATCRMILQP